QRTREQKRARTPQEVRARRPRRSGLVLLRLRLGGVVRALGGLGGLRALGVLGLRLGRLLLRGRGGRRGGAGGDHVQRLGNQLDDGQRGVVALPRTDLGDPGVAAGTLGERRRELGEEVVHDALVTDDGEHLATVVDVALLR